MSLAESYNEWISSLEEKGFPNPRIVIPAILVLVLLLAGFFIISGGKLPGDESTSSDTKRVSLRVTDESGNPVVGASVRLLYEGEAVPETSDDTGYAVFTGVPKDASIKISVTAQGFEPIVGEELPSGEVISLTPTLRLPSTQELGVQVEDELGNPVESATVIFSGTGLDLSESTDSFGTAYFQLNADEIPSRATINVEASGYKKAVKSVTQSELSSVIRFTLSFAASDDDGSSPRDGPLYLRVLDLDGNAVPRASVKLIDYATDAIFSIQQAEQDGSATFLRVSFGKKIRFQITADGFTSFSGTASGAAFEEFADTSLPYVIYLTKLTVPEENALNVIVVDSDNVPIGGAMVSVYDRSTKAFLDSKRTDFTEGKSVLYLAKSKNFFASVYADGFLPAVIETTSAGELERVVLTRESPGNYFDLPVTVKQDGEVVPNALVSLYRSDGFPAGVLSATTDADGTAFFRVPTKLNSRSYSIYAVASLDALSGRSDLVTAADGAALFVSIAPEPATLNVNAIDVVTGERVPNTLISLILDGQEVASCDSPCNFTILPETEFLLRAEASGYLDAETSTLILGPGEDSFTKISLYPQSLVKTVSSRFQGLFDSKTNPVREAANAEYYTAKFLVTVPESSEETFFFASVGDTQSVNDGYIAITSIDSSGFKSFATGSGGDECSFDNATGESNIGLIKWVLLELPSGFVGTKEVSFRVLVRPDAPAGTQINLLHRLSGLKKNVPFLAPSDEPLLNSLLQKSITGNRISSPDFCNAKKNEEKIRVDADPLVCDENNYCTKLVFTDEGGLSARSGFSTLIGKTFTAKFVLFNEIAPLTGLSVNTNEDLEIISIKQDDTGNFNMHKTLSFADATQRISLNAAPGEKVSGTITFKALRSSAFSPVDLNIFSEDSSEPAASLAAGVQVSGSNTFQVQLSSTELVAGIRQTQRTTIRDVLGFPVPDAVLTYYDCDAFPLNGQDIVQEGDDSRNNGEDGVYSTSLSPSSIGTIGLRVSRPGFKTYDQCLIRVSGGDFIEVDPSVITLRGDSSEPELLSRTITVTNLLPANARVTSSVSCTSKTSATLKTTPLYVVPQSFNLQGSAPVQLLVKANETASANCYITFSASLNPLETTTASVFVDTELTAPLPVTYCPLSTGYQCYSYTQTPGSNCVLQPLYSCPALSQSCYTCQVGVSTLPSSISLTVSLNKPVASFESQIALETAPEECKIEGFESNPSYLPPSTYGNMYPNVPTDYWNYQSNPYQQYNQPYTGYQQNQYLQLPSYNTPGINPNAPLTTGYGYPYGATNPQYPNTGFTPYATSTLPYPPYAQPYCPPQLNTQALAGSYYSSSSYSGSYYAQGGYGSGYGMPYNYPSNCQYPAICQPGALQACGYFSSTTTTTNYQYSYGTGFNYPPQCQYPAVCTNPTACTQFNQPYTPYPPSPQSPYTPSPYYYPQTRPPVNVRIESCTQTNLVVTAEYTGNDYFYSGALGGTQNGFLLIKASGQQQKRIPITVTVNTPTTQYPPTTGYPPFPLTSSFMPQCLQTFPPFEAGITDATGLDENGLPSEIALKMNPYSKKATYKREIQPRYPGTSLQKTEGFKENDVRVDSFAPTLKITAKPRSKNSMEIESETGDLLVTFPSFQAQKIIKIPTSVQEDDFGVKYMALFVNNKDYSAERKPDDDKIKAYYSDVAIYEPSIPFKKCSLKASGVKLLNANCAENHIALAATTSTSPSDKGVLTITEAEDYSEREIPIQVVQVPDEINISLTAAHPDAVGTKGGADCHYAVVDKKTLKTLVNCKYAFKTPLKINPTCSIKPNYILTKPTVGSKDEVKKEVKTYENPGDSSQPPKDDASAGATSKPLDVLSLDSAESDSSDSDKEKTYSAFGAKERGLAGGSEGETSSELCDAEQIYFQLDFGEGTGYAGKEQVALLSITMPDRVENYDKLIQITVNGDGEIKGTSPSTPAVPETPSDYSDVSPADTRSPRGPGAAADIKDEGEKQSCTLTEDFYKTLAEPKPLKTGTCETKPKCEEMGGTSYEHKKSGVQQTEDACKAREEFCCIMPTAYDFRGVVMNTPDEPDSSYSLKINVAELIPNPPAIESVRLLISTKQITSFNDFDPDETRKGIWPDIDDQVLKNLNLDAPDTPIRSAVLKLDDKVFREFFADQTAGTPLYYFVSIHYNPVPDENNLIDSAYYSFKAKTTIYTPSAASTAATTPKSKSGSGGTTVVMPPSSADVSEFEKKCVFSSTQESGILPCFSLSTLLDESGLPPAGFRDETRSPNVNRIYYTNSKHYSDRSYSGAHDAKKPESIVFLLKKPNTVPFTFNKEISALYPGDNYEIAFGKVDLNNRGFRGVNVFDARTMVLIKNIEGVSGELEQVDCNNNLWKAVKAGSNAVVGAFGLDFGYGFYFLLNKGLQVDYAPIVSKLPGSGYPQSGTCAGINVLTLYAEDDLMVVQVVKEGDEDGAWTNSVPSSSSATPTSPTVPSGSPSTRSPTSASASSAPVTVKPSHSVTYDGHPDRPKGSQLINSFAIDSKEYRAVDASTGAVNGDIAVLLGKGGRVTLNSGDVLELARVYESGSDLFAEFDFLPPSSTDSYSGVVVFDPLSSRHVTFLGTTKVYLLYAEDDADDSNDLAVFQILADSSPSTPAPVSRQMLFDGSSTKPTESKTLDSFTLDTTTYTPEADEVIVALIGDDAGAVLDTMTIDGETGTDEYVINGHPLGTPIAPVVVGDTPLILDLKWDDASKLTVLNTYLLNDVGLIRKSTYSTKKLDTTYYSEDGSIGVVKTALYYENIDSFSSKTLVVLRISPLD